MGFWHTGYVEFHEPTGLGEYVYTPSQPVSYPCELCTELFADLEALRRHRFEQHPYRQPVLLLRGRQVGMPQQLLTTPLRQNDVLVEDTSRCRLNGQLVQTEHLGQILSTMRQECVDVELSNPEATRQWRLDFRVADEADLAGVESAFLILTRERVLDLQAVARFNNRCRDFNSALSYCDGIAHYLYGVMAKERHPDCGLRQEEYIGRFQCASQILSNFDRALACSVRALVAFNFNQFEDVEALAPDESLRRAAAAFANCFRGLAWPDTDELPAQAAKPLEALLTDQDTLQILAAANQGLQGLSGCADELWAQQRRPDSNEYDRLKRMVLACEALVTRADRESQNRARTLARELSARTKTHTWAMTMLERLQTP